MSFPRKQESISLISLDSHFRKCWKRSAFRSPDSSRGETRHILIFKPSGFSPSRFYRGTLNPTHFSKLSGHISQWLTSQISGIMTLPIATTYPVVNNRVVVNGGGSIKQAPALAGNDPAGGNVARGTVIAVTGTTSATLVLN